MRLSFVLTLTLTFVMAASASAASALNPSPMLSALKASEEEEQLGISTNVSDVFFLLYTPTTGLDDPVEVPADVASPEGRAALEEAGFDPDLGSFFVFHGFWSGSGFVEEFVPDLLEKGDYNVVGVEWPDLAHFPFFWQAAENAVYVGEYAGEFVAALMGETGLEHDRVHMIGHSDGSHASGHAGRTVYAITGVRVARVTALEPAFPWFRLHDESLRVGKGDANFVDVWHTNSGKLIDICLSFPESMGHVDFYPAGGEHQPGCTEFCSPNGCTEADIIELFKGGCSHSRSHHYFVESINGETKFMATRCSSYDDFLSGACDGEPVAEMGLDLSPDAAEGTYYLDVNSESPYAMG